MGWISNNEIVYSRRGTVWVRDLETGVEDTLNAELSAGWFHHPLTSPDSGIVFMSNFGSITAVDTQSKREVRALSLDVWGQAITSNGYLLYSGDPYWSIWARKIDLKTRTFSGAGVAVLRIHDADRMAVSRQGHLIYQPLQDLDRKSMNEPIYSYMIGGARTYVTDATEYTDDFHDEFRISPDGRYLAIYTWDYGWEKGILRFDRTSRQTIALTPPQSDSLRYRVGQWSGDGKYFYYYERTILKSGERIHSIYRVDVDGTHVEPVIVEDTNDGNHSISDDGRVFAFERHRSDSESDIWVKFLDTGEEFPLSTAEGRQNFPHVSPDGRFVAYSSGPEGDASIIVARLSDGSSQLVAEHMQRARWSRNGRYLFYESKILGEIYRVRLLEISSNSTGSSLTFSDPETVWSYPRSNHTHWYPASDEDTFLLSALDLQAPGTAEWKIILNWAQTLEN